MKKSVMAVIAILTIIAIVAPITVWLVMRDGVESHPLALRPTPDPIAFSTVRVNYDNEHRYVQMPHVLDFFHDETEGTNHFLLDIGRLQHTYMSTIFDPIFTPGGNVTINMSYTRTRTDEIREAAQQSVTNSLSVTTTAGLEVNKRAEIQGRLPLGSATASTSVTANFSITAAVGQTRNFTTNLEQAQTFGTTETFGVTIGPNAVRGYYRAAMYAVSDIFIILTTCEDNEELLAFEEVVAARPGSLTRRVEFSPTDNFDNSPITTINLPQMDCIWFLRALSLQTPNSDRQWAMVSAGAGHSLAVTECGELWAWGENGDGRTGLGVSTGYTLIPTRVGNAYNWATVSTGSARSFAITTDGELWAWGRNSFGGTGLGIYIGYTPVPTRVGNASNWATIATGSSHSLATTTNGELWAWGLNDNARTGLNINTGNTSVPTRVGSASSWATVSAGSTHSLATTTNGELWAWGDNFSGRTGLNISSGNTLVPTRVGSATNWEMISANSSHSLAITTNGELWAWGSNTHGKLGVSSGNMLVPTQVGTATNWATAVAGTNHSVATTTNGELWAWGQNDFGRTGLGISTGNTIAPTRIGTGTNWATVSDAVSHAITTNGELWAWGPNWSGRLGDGTTVNRHTPVRIA